MNFLLIKVINLRAASPDGEDRLNTLYLFQELLQVSRKYLLLVLFCQESILYPGDHRRRIINAEVRPKKHQVRADGL